VKLLLLAMFLYELFPGNRKLSPVMENLAVGAAGNPHQ
jgi:hypothetical protein